VLRRGILEYNYDYNFKFLAPFSKKRILDGILNLFQTGTIDEKGQTFVFLKDLCTNFAGRKRSIYYIAFTQSPYREPLRKELERLLLCSNASIRWNAIAAVERLRFDCRDLTLRKAYPFFVERDPFGLYALLRSLAWIQCPNAWGYYHRSFEHKSYLVRWAGLAAMESYNCLCAKPSAKEFRAMEKLANDSHPLIVAEARYRLREKRDELLAPFFTYRERKYRAKLQTNRMPQLDFGHIHQGFSLHLHYVLKQEDFTIPQLDQYVGQCEKAGKLIIPDVPELKPG
jgi:hypothetical protein